LSFPHLSTFSGRWSFSWKYLKGTPLSLIRYSRVLLHLRFATLIVPSSDLILEAGPVCQKGRKTIIKRSPKNQKTTIFLNNFLLMSFQAIFALSAQKLQASTHFRQLIHSALFTAFISLKLNPTGHDLLQAPHFVQVSLFLSSLKNENFFIIQKKPPSGQKYLHHQFFVKSDKTTIVPRIPYAQ